MVHRVRYYATICECSFSSKFFSLYCEAKLILSGCKLACYSKLVGSSQKKLATAKEKVKGIGGGEIKKVKRDPTSSLGMFSEFRQ